MTEAGKGAEEVQDILLKNVAMFQKYVTAYNLKGCLAANLRCFI